MNIKEIKEMIQLMNENNLSEFELEKEGLKIRLKKGASGAIEQSMLPVEAPSKEAAAKSKEEAAKDQATSRIAVKSPMVGTFYAAPAPEAPPFVQIGSQVEVGQVVCVIEAMKLMNEIKSEVRGKIAEIAVQNGDPVEFGQTLFVLE